MLRMAPPRCLTDARTAQRTAAARARKVTEEAADQSDHTAF